MYILTDYLSSSQFLQMKLSMKMMMADICLDSNVDEDDSDNV